MDRDVRTETLADALDACDVLQGLIEYHGRDSDAQRLGTVRRVLRRQALLLVRLAMLWRQSPRDFRLLDLLVAEAANEQHVMPDDGLPVDLAQVVEKPVPGPTPNPKD